MPEKQPKTITLPAWLSMGNILSVVTVLGAAIGVVAANAANTARSDERIAYVMAEQERIKHEYRMQLQQLRTDIQTDLREMRTDIRQLLRQQQQGAR